MALIDLIRFFNPKISDEDAAAALQKLEEVDSKLTALAQAVNESPAAKSFLALSQALEKVAKNLEKSPLAEWMKNIDPERVKEFAESMEKRNVAYIPLSHFNVRPNEPSREEPTTEQDAGPPPAPARVVRGFRKDE